MCGLGDLGLLGVQGILRIGLYNIDPCLFACVLVITRMEGVSEATDIVKHVPTFHAYFVPPRAAWPCLLCSESDLYIFLSDKLYFFLLASSAYIRLWLSKYRTKTQRSEAVYISIYSVFSFNPLNTENISLFSATKNKMVHISSKEKVFSNSNFLKRAEISIPSVCLSPTGVLSYIKLSVGCIYDINCLLCPLTDKNYQSKSLWNVESNEEKLGNHADFWSQLLWKSENLVDG